MNTTKMKTINCYGIYIENKYTDYETIKRKQKNIYQLIKRTISNDVRFKDISFIIGISNTDKKDIKIIYAKTNKKGRPKKIILGKKIQWHFHIYILTKEKYISYLGNEICKKLRKKEYSIKQFKHDNGEKAIEYINRQCQNIWMYGDYFKSHNNKENE